MADASTQPGSRRWAGERTRDSRPLPTPESPGLSHQPDRSEQRGLMMNLVRPTKRRGAVLVAATVLTLLTTAGGAASDVVTPRSAPSAAPAPVGAPTPTVVLVHGADAESSSWLGVITRLERRGYPVIAFANPLRSLAGDAASLTDLLRTIQGPVVLVGHSYGGMVISVAAAGQQRVKSLVFVDAQI